MTRAYVGVGSNIEPEANVRRALHLLAGKVRVLAVSTFYRTAAEGRPGDPDYVNGAVAIETSLSPEALKGQLRGIEGALGRRRTVDKLAPRPIDLDLLLYGEQQARQADLVLPHPDIARRAFVAVPLAEIAPDIVLPGAGERLRDLAARWHRRSMVPLPHLTGDLRGELTNGSAAGP